MNKLNIQNIKLSDSFKKYKLLACKPKNYKTSLRDENNNIFGQYGTLHSTTLFSHIAILRCLFNEFKNGIFIDLGCGVGIPLILALHHDWNAVGVEISKGSFSCCKKNINFAKKNNYINNNCKYKLFNKSFFPAEFQITTDKKNGEDDFREELNKLSNDNNDNIDSSILKKCTLWYHYQVERRQNILNLFSKYATINSILVFSATRNDSFKLPKDIIEIDNLDDMWIYKKN